MKKFFYMAAAMAVALSSCTSELDVAEENGAALEEGAVAFNAYTNRTNRAVIQEIENVKAKGFGVFAYDQGASSYLTYSSNSSYPNFMYNQKVAWDHTSYSPKTVTLPEWDAITDAEIRNLYEGNVSLNATPTFTESEKKELVALGSPWNDTWTEATGGYNAPSGATTLTLDQYHNLSTSVLKGKFTGNPTAKSGATINDADDFFALSSAKQSYYVGTGGSDWKYSPVKYYNNNVDARHSFFAYAPYDPDVKSIFAIGNAPAIRYNAADDIDLLYAPAVMDMFKPGVTHKIDFPFKHALSQVNIFVAPFVNKVHTDAANDHKTGDALNEKTKIVVRSVKFVGTVASQGILNLKDGSWSYEATEEAAYEVHDPVTLTTQTTTTTGVPTYEIVKKGMMVIPTLQDQPVKIQIVYDVITTDPNNSVNSSTVTNTIVSKEAFDLKQSTAYNFFLDLGMTDVKFKASVKVWNAPTENTNNVDLPNNSYWHPSTLAEITGTTAPTAKTVNVVSAKPATTTSDAYYYNTTEGVMYKYKATNDWEIETIASLFYDETAKKYYQVAATSGATTVYDGNAVHTNSKYYVGAGTGTDNIVDLKSLVVDSKGQIQLADGTWEAPAANKIYRYDGQLYIWSSVED